MHRWISLRHQGARVQFWGLPISMDWFCWENLNRKPWFLPSNIELSCKFSHHPILWVSDPCENGGPSPHMRRSWYIVQLYHENFPSISDYFTICSCLGPSVDHGTNDPHHVTAFTAFAAFFSLRSFGAQSKSRAVLASARRRVGMRLAAKIDVASSKVTWILMGFNHGFTIGVGKSTIQRWFPRQNFHSWRYRLGYWRVEN